MYIVHTTRPDRQELWTPFRYKELAVAHAEASNFYEDVTSTAYEINGDPVGGYCLDEVCDG